MNWLLLFSFAALCSADSDISTFEDSSCEESWQILKGPNGYPDGICTPLREQGTLGSFQVVGVDSGCQVTIYQNDTTSDQCSGFPMLAEIATCYNTSWVYYSIDNCIKPSSSSTSLLSSSSATSSSSAVVSQSHTGAIVGGVLGGVLVLAIIIGVAIYFLVRRRRSTGAIELPPPPAYEISGEMAEKEKPAPPRFPASVMELSNNSEIYEKDEDKRSSVKMQPVELPTDANWIK